VLDVPAAAAYLGGVSDDVVRHLVSGGQLQRARLPHAERRVLITRESLDRLVDQHTTTTE
jgi:hypothetical protein